MTRGSIRAASIIYTAVVSAALRQAVKWGLVSDAATGRATPPPRRQQPKQIPRSTVIQLLIADAEERGQPVLATAIAIAATTGLRRGELAGLCWSDVDLDAGRLQVRRSIKKDLSDHWVPGPTKSHQGRRIALDAFTVAVLRRHRSRAEQWAEEAGTNPLAMDTF